MYVWPNFKSKKALKEAVKSGVRVTVFGVGLSSGPEGRTECFVEGPHYPEPHRWYAKVKTDGSAEGVVLGVS